MYSSHGMYSAQAKEKFTRTQRAHSTQLRTHNSQFEKNIPACTVRTQRRKNLLAHSEEYTAHNLKKYTGMYSSHTAKEKFTRTQRGAHSSQFEKNIPACTVRTQRRKNLLAHSSQFEKIYRHVQFALAPANLAHTLKKNTGILAPNSERHTAYN